MGFARFPRKVRYTPVPSPLFGPLLEQIDDMAELKCTLRLIWLLHQMKGFPRSVSLAELQGDRVLAKALGGDGKDPRTEIERAADSAVERGTFLATRAPRRAYLLNSEAERRALGEGAVGVGPPAEDTPQAGPWEGAVERPNVFGLYEDNIGMLSPMIAEELKEAEAAYPQSWIEEAFREAVTRNKRSWRYISAILENWEREGRADGGTGRYPKTAGHEGYHRG